MGDYSCCAQQSFLEELREPNGILGIKLGSADCKASNLPTVLSLQAQPGVTSKPGIIPSGPGVNPEYCLT